MTDEKSAISDIFDIHSFKQGFKQITYNIRTISDQKISRKCSAWKDFGLSFWFLSLQRKSKVCGLRWGGMDELEVKSLALVKGLIKA